jgi:DNA-binding response OmpR family regulator
MLKKVLLIDDDQEIIELYSIAFNTSEFDLLVEHGGTDGLATAIGMAPDLIMLDIKMHDVDGIEVLRQLKKNKHTASIPVVMFTNITDIRVIEEAKKLGAADYWEKSKVNPKEAYLRSKKILNME